MTAPILFEETGRLGLVTLNRPAHLNALTHDMALMLEERLLHWRGREDI
ncbi:MAG: enoyl-CoA hydratase/isomerase family protein, partial [Armatimonadetes bacterium]|nr:enoyl-CoA hydratase/isomerase family protein [Armatimonadota bacterium]